MPESTADRKTRVLRKVDEGRPYAHRAVMGALPAAAIARAYQTGPVKTTAAIALGAGLGVADKHLERLARRKSLRPVLKNYAAESSMQKKADTDDRVERHRAQLSDLFPTAAAGAESTPEFLDRVEKRASIDTSHDEKAGISGRPAWGVASSSSEEANVEVVNNLMNQLSGHTHEMRKATEAQLGGLFANAGSSYGRHRAIGRTAAEAAGPLSRAFSSR